MAKRKITLLYGEGTVQVYFRLPESKRDEIEEKFWKILKEYENPTKVEIEVSNPFKSREHPLKEKSIIRDKIIEMNNTDEAGQFINPEEEVINVKKDKIKVLQEIADTIKNGGVAKSDLFLKKKVNIDEEYEFEYVKSIPDQDDQIVIDKKGLAFYSKYDLGVFYVKWEGKYMRFDNKAEFDRFGKEYLTF